MNRISVFTLICLLTATFVVGAEQWRIKSAVYRGEMPTVGDVFALESKNLSSKEIEKLLSQPLSVPMGKSWQKVSDILDRHLINGSGLNGKVWFDICQSIQLNDVKDKLLRDVNEQLNSDFVRVIDVARTKSKPLCLAVEPETISYSLANSAVISQRAQIQLNHVEDKVTLKELTVQLSIEVKAPTYDRAFTKGDLINVNDEDFVWQESHRVITSQVIEKSGYTGVARKQLRANVPLNKQSIEEKVAVELGTQVTVLLVKPGIQIKSQGRALSRGNVGEAVSVIVSQATSPVSAIVAAEGVVHVSI